MGVAAIVPGMHGLLGKVSGALVARGLAHRINDDHPDLLAIEHYFARVYLHDLFHRSEAWHDAYFGYTGFDEHLGDNAMAAKSALAISMRRRHLAALTINAALKDCTPQEVRFFGIPDDLAGFYNANFDEKLPVAPVTARRKGVLNAAMAFGLVVYCLIWILARTRLSATEGQAFFLAADFVSDPRDVRLYHELSDGGPLLVIPRNRSHGQSPLLAEIGNDPVIRPRETGRFSVGAGLQAMGKAIREAAALYRHLGWLAPDHFRAVIVLPFHRARERGLALRYRPRFFWCRDETNPEHILRRQEIHKIGGRTIGVQHGWPTLAIVQPMWRYISMDTFYVFGRAIYERYWRDTWAPDMKVRAVGSFGARREDYAVAAVDKPGDILVMVSLTVGEAAIIESVRALAAAFPDKTIYLQIKRSFRDKPAAREMVNACTDERPNVRPTDAPIFDLFRSARYAFSDASTTVVEALQFGLRSFFLDMLSGHRACIYREFPGVRVETPLQAVERIKAIEAGRPPYTQDDVDLLADFSGKPFFDVVREDMNLPTRPGEAKGR